MIRLDKYICKSTESTRNEAKRLLKMGRITVNGEIEKSGATKIPENSEVCIQGRTISLPGPQYIMMNKPLDSICSNVDEELPSILHLVEIDRAFELHIAGRLDADTTGLVFITNDGKWSHNIISPKKVCGKTYRVWLADPIAHDVAEQFKLGVQLNNERDLTLPAQLEVIAEKEVLLTITEGKYHQVKRMFAAIGNKVVGLHREQIGGISLDEDLSPGQWRYLTEDEVANFS